MSTYEDRLADARDEARQMMHGDPPECPERPCQDYPLCGHDDDEEESKPVHVIDEARILYLSIDEEESKPAPRTPTD